jgi:hypothetical protein
MVKAIVIEFIIAIVVTKCILSFLKHLTLFLQKTNCDMVVAFDEVQKTLNMLKGHRTDETISELFDHLLLITGKSSLEFIVNVVKKGKVHCCSAELTFGLSL